MPVVNFKNKEAKFSAICLILVYALPILGAYALYALKDKTTFNTTENGVMLKPAVHLDSLSLLHPPSPGKWLLVYVQPKTCLNACQQMETTLKQIQIALGKDKSKLGYQLIPYVSHPLLAEGNIILIDPRGWYIMYYPPSTNPQGILKDVRRLLRYTHAA